MLVEVRGGRVAHAATAALALDALAPGCELLTLHARLADGVGGDKACRGGGEGGGGGSGGGGGA